MMGGNEPIVDLHGDRIVDSHGRVSRVTSAGYGPSVGKHLLMGYVPNELATAGTQLQVMYMNELFPRNCRGPGFRLRSRRLTSERLMFRANVPN